jgi:alpha-galactosidase
MYSAPLMLGCDIRTMDEKTLKLVTNKDLIRIDQDLEARPPMAVFHPWNKKMLTLLKHLDDGTYALGFFNMGEEDAETYATFSDFGLPAAAGYDLALESVFDGERLVSREYLRLNVPAHDCRVYIAKLQKR